MRYFAHGIWIYEEEMELLAEKGLSSIAICTESNLKLSSVFAPIKKYQEKASIFVLELMGLPVTIIWIYLQKCL